MWAGVGQALGEETAVMLPKAYEQVTAYGDLSFNSAGYCNERAVLFEVDGTLLDRFGTSKPNYSLN